MPKKPTITEELVAGFTEMADALEADIDLGSKFNFYQMKIDLKPQTYTPELVRGTRKLLGASQSVFARFLGVSHSTVSQWEQGSNTPKPMARRFMDEIRRNPDYYRKRLSESMVPKGRKMKRV